MPRRKPLKTGFGNQLEAAVKKAVADGAFETVAAISKALGYQNNSGVYKLYYVAKPTKGIYQNLRKILPEFEGQFDEEDLLDGRNIKVEEQEIVLDPPVPDRPVGPFQRRLASVTSPNRSETPTPWGLMVIECFKKSIKKGAYGDLRVASKAVGFQSAATLQEQLFNTQPTVTFYDNCCILYPELLGLYEPWQLTKSRPSVTPLRAQKVLHLTEARKMTEADLQKYSKKELLSLATRSKFVADTSAGVSEWNALAPNTRLTALVHHLRKIPAKQPGTMPVVQRRRAARHVVLESPVESAVAPSSPSSPSGPESPTHPVAAEWSLRPVNVVVQRNLKAAKHWQELLTQCLVKKMSLSEVLVAVQASVEDAETVAATVV